MNLKLVYIHLAFAFLTAMILFAITHAITNPAYLSIILGISLAIAFVYGKPFVKKYGRIYKQQFFFIAIVAIVLSFTSFIGNTTDILYEFAVIVIGFLIFFVILMNVRIRL